MKYHFPMGVFKVYVLRDLSLERVFVIYPGEKRYTLAERVEVVPLSAIAGEGSALR